ncbi:MAG TPA: hypothetical protein PKE47_11655, partial [Verrucomicrobiota bacterium]|nr:hypothetical protein [Verrucomicrobiota bacterium]
MHRLIPALALVSALAAPAAEPPASPHVRPLTPPGGPKPFSYIPAADRLPNYVASARWGTQGEDITEMQAPLEP